MLDRIIEEVAEKRGTAWVIEIKVVYNNDGH